MMPHIMTPIGDQYEVRRSGRDIVLTIEPGKRERFAAQNELYAKRARYAPIMGKRDALKVAVTQPCDPDELELRMTDLGKAEDELSNLMVEIDALKAIVERDPGTVEIRVSADDVASMQFQL